MSRQLAQIDPNLPPLESSPDPNDLAPSPSKEHPKKPDRMREWTFPRQAAAASNSSPAASSSSGSIHAKSSSIAARAAPNKGPSPPSASSASSHEPTLTKDLRHRSNFSLAMPSTPELSISVPTTTTNTTTTNSTSSHHHHPNPKAAGGFSSHSYSPSRLNPALSDRPSPGIGGSGAGAGGGRGGGGKNGPKGWFNDVAYFVVFGGAFVLFASSLFGVGYRAPVLEDVVTTTTTTRAAAAAGARAAVDEAAPRRIVLDHVEIAKGFLDRGGDGDGDGDAKFPADVYQSVGDSSHDRGREFVKSSPDDPALDDEHVHDVHHPEAESALFPHVEHADELDDYANLHAKHVENRPRPARLPPLGSEEEEQERGAHTLDDDGRNRRVGRPAHRHDGHEREHALLEPGEDDLDDDDDDDEEEDEDITYEGDEIEVPNDAHHDDEPVGQEGEELIDDSISIARSPNRGGRGRSDASHENGIDGADDDKDEDAARRESEASLTALEELLLDAEDDDDDDEAEPLTPEEEEAQHLALKHRRPVGGGAGGGADALERLRREREELGRARLRWEARVRDGLGDEDDQDGDEEDGSGWNGSEELRQRQRRSSRMSKRIRR